MIACERPPKSGANKGKARTGTTAGYHAHQRAKEAACEACAAAYSDYKRQWYERNRDDRIEYARQYHVENREALLERKRQYYVENREAHRKRRRQYYVENREALLEQKRQYHAENREALLERKRQYYVENREAHRKYRRQYHAENREALLERKREYYWTHRTPQPNEDEPRWVVYRALYISPELDADPWHGAVYYVGQTCKPNPEQRWQQHARSKRWLDNTIWQVVEAGLTRREAFDLENRLVDEHYSTLTNDAAVQRRDAEDIPHPPYRAFTATAFTNR